MGRPADPRLGRALDDLPLTLGDELGRVCLGAAPGQVVLGDSTTVLLYKLIRAALAARPGRTEIVIDRDHFPTDRYVAMGIADECGLTLRWVDVDTTAGLTAEQVADVVGEQTALVMVNHVSYRSAWLADVPAITGVAHDAGALVLVDMCHSVGVVPSSVDAWDVDLAVGCTYKYLNGGPGSPAFAYVAAHHLDSITQPIQGWMGNTDPFLMGPDYVPTKGIRRFLSGTPAIVGMLGIQDMLELIDEAGLAAVREKSVGLTDARHRARGRAPRVVRGAGGVATQCRAPRRARHVQPPTHARGGRCPVGARRDPRLPRPGWPAHRPLAALDVVRRARTRHGPGAGRARRSSLTRPRFSPV